MKWKSLLQMRAFRMTLIEKNGYKPCGITVLHDLLGVARDLALEQFHLLGAGRPATQALADEATEVLFIGIGEADAVALDSSVFRLLVCGLVLADMNQSLQRPAGIASEVLV